MRREDERRFTVEGDPDNSEDVLVTCDRCGTVSRCCGMASLADVVDAAEEHAEVCP
jgi:hypothetical protein